MLLVGPPEVWVSAGYVAALEQDHPVAVVDVGPMIQSRTTTGIGLDDVAAALLSEADEVTFDSFVAWGYSQCVPPVLATACVSSRVRGIVCGGLPIPPPVDLLPNRGHNRLDAELATWSAAAPDLLTALPIPKLLFFGSDDDTAGCFADRIRSSSSELATMGFEVLEIPGANHARAFSSTGSVVSWATARLQSPR